MLIPTILCSIRIGANKKSRGSWGGSDAAGSRLRTPMPERTRIPTKPSIKPIARLENFSAGVNATKPWHLSKRQGEVEHRPMADLAGDSNFAAVGFYDGFGDGETHTGALYLQAMISSPVELFE